MHKLVLRNQLKIESIETKLKLKLSINKIYMYEKLIPIEIDTIGIESIHEHGLPTNRPLKVGFSKK